MIPAISSISRYSDLEYQRIIAEMLKLGLVPSGNKYIDKIKVNQAKKEKEEEIFEPEEPKTNTNQVREEMEEERLGATILGNVNRYILGI